jgi:hypothetical protein
MMPSGIPRPAPISVASVASSSVAGNTRARSLGDWILRDVRLPEVEMRDVSDIRGELDVERLIQPHLLIDALVSCLISLIADHGNDRIGRHHTPPDHEGDHQQAQQGRQNDGKGCCHFPQGGKRGFAAARLTSVVCAIPTSFSSQGNYSPLETVSQRVSQVECPT